KRGQNRKRRRDAHHQMKMSGDEVLTRIASGESTSCKKNSGKPSRQEQRNETHCKKHRRRKTNISTADRAEPTSHKKNGRNAERRRKHREHKRSIWIEPARKHVLAPNAKTKQTYGA